MSWSLHLLYSGCRVLWMYRKTTMGGHLLRYPWSAISDWAWYRTFQYRTEERGVRHYIGYRNKLFRYPISDILYSIDQHNGREVRRAPVITRVLGSNPVVMRNIYWISDIGIDSDIDNGILPVSEWQFSVRHTFFRYPNNRCRCRCPPMKTTYPHDCMYTLYTHGKLSCGTWFGSLSASCIGDQGSLLHWQSCSPVLAVLSKLF